MPKNALGICYESNTIFRNRGIRGQVLNSSNLLIRIPNRPTNCKNSKGPKLSLSELTPPAQPPSSLELARAASHAVRHLRALDSANVPQARASSLPASGAVSRRKPPKLSLSDLTSPAQGPSRPRLSHQTL